MKKETTKKRVNSRAKGGVGEREVVKILRGLGYTARRSQQYCGNTGEANDIVIEGYEDFHFEIKFVKKIKDNFDFWNAKLLHEWIEQCERDSKGKRCFLIFRENKGEWFVLQEATDRWVVPSESTIKISFVSKFNNKRYAIYLLEELFCEGISI